MTSKRIQRLPAKYAGLTGYALLRQAVEDGRFDLLEALWLYRDAGLASSIVGLLLESGDARLNARVVEEVLEPSMAEPFPASLVTALNDRLPPLPPDAAKRLAERLRDPAQLTRSEYEGARGPLEMWVLGQPGSVGEDFALAVIALETPAASQALVLESAYQRCRASDALLVKAVRVIQSKIDEQANAETWTRAAGFIEGACRNSATPPEAARRIVRWLIETAPELASNPSLAPVLTQLASSFALEQLRERLEGTLEDRPGSGALIRLLRDVPRARDRANLTALALAKQPHLWSTLSPLVDSWDEAEWRRVLEALVGSGAIERSILQYLIDHAPLAVTASVTTFALDQAETPDDNAISRAGARVETRLAELEGDANRAERVTLIPWPAQRAKGERRDLVRTLLRSFGDDRHVELVLDALLEGKIDAPRAAELLPDGSAARTLVGVADEGLRLDLAAALEKQRPAEFVAALQQLQRDSFSLDFAERFAEREPDAAFVGCDEQFLVLDDEGKDRLVDLLARFGSRNQIPALQAVVGVKKLSNAPRRVQAADRIAALLEEGEAVPESIIELLESSRSELVDAGVRAIGAVKPRDPALIRRLHELMKAGGMPARTAEGVLDTLAEDLVGEIQVTDDEDGLSKLLSLLGTAARPQGVDSLLTYIGPDALVDDRRVRRASASGLEEASGLGVDITIDQQERITALLDGEGPEVDPEARKALNGALGRIMLGEDAVLAELYKMAGYDPGRDPDTLFGSEKSRIVRHVDLYIKERERDRSGWGARITQLDNVAEGLVRAAYVRSDGGSDAMRDEIRRDPKKPDYGNLITALNSIGGLSRVAGELQVLHKLRCERTEVPHAGQSPTERDVTVAEENFGVGAKACLVALKKHT